MEYFYDPDVQYVGKLCVLSMVCLFIGRISKRIKGESNFNKSIAALNSKILKSSEKKFYFSVLKYRFKVYSSFLLIFSIFSAYLIYFPLSSLIDYKEEIISIFFGFTAILYILSHYSNYKSCEFTQSEALHKQRLTLIRDEIIKEIGPEVVDALRGNECSKKCTEEIKKLTDSIAKYQKLIEKFSKFQWCDGCPQQKKCAGNCGPSFWLYAKDSLREFKYQSSK